MNPSKRRPFNRRAFAALALAICGLMLPVSAVLMEEGRHGQGRNLWGPVHGAFGLLFVAFALWHIYMNRRLMWNHIKGAPAKAHSVSRELIVAVVLIGACMALLLGHEFV
jgi:protein-S-isoprenylcysteine O-methyltransferase Ste14